VVPSARKAGATHTPRIAEAQHRRDHSQEGLLESVLPAPLAISLRFQHSPAMNDSAPADPGGFDRFSPDSAYAYARLGVSLAIATIVGAGMWAVIVVLPKVQIEFGIDRSAASAPYTFMMLGFAFGTIVLGRMADRTGIVVPVLVAGSCLGLGFVLAGLAPNLVVFSAAHGLLIGVGAGTGFAPMMADISHWFVKRRGLAVVVVASGNYLAGAIWPLLMNWTMPLIGWRHTYMAIGLFAAATVIPAAFFLRRRPSAQMIAQAEAATDIARADVGISPRLLLALLVVAGFCCCTAMSMPQVHIVAYCGDLGYGVARGAEMLSLMLFLGIISRVGSGIVSDMIGGTATLLIGSFMQGLALLLYLYFDGLTSLFVVSGIFGLFQGGIVPMYAVICRELLPPREAGAKIGLVVSATILGMAFGGYFSGVIFDLTSSYRMAFLNGMLWNALNLAVVGWLLWRRQKLSPKPRMTAAA
jgi:MFS family permease